MVFGLHVRHAISSEWNVTMREPLRRDSLGATLTGMFAIVRRQDSHLTLPFSRALQPVPDVRELEGSRPRTTPDGSIASTEQGEADLRASGPRQRTSAAILSTSTDMLVGPDDEATVDEQAADVFRHEGIIDVGYFGKRYKVV